MLTGPAIGGVIVAQAGVPWAMALDAVRLSVSAMLLTRLRPAPPTDRSTPPSPTSIVEGVRYAAARPDLLGTYVIDLIARFMAILETGKSLWIVTGSRRARILAV